MFHRRMDSVRVNGEECKALGASTLCGLRTRERERNETLWYCDQLYAKQLLAFDYEAKMRGHAGVLINRLGDWIAPILTAMIEFFLCSGKSRLTTQR